MPKLFNKDQRNVLNSGGRTLVRSYCAIDLKDYKRDEIAIYKRSGKYYVWSAGKNGAEYVGTSIADCYMYCQDKGYIPKDKGTSRNAGTVKSTPGKKTQSRYSNAIAKEKENIEYRNATNGTILRNATR